MQNLKSLKGKKIAFFGTPDFTVEFLELFKSLELNISLIVTGEDKPVGRGMQMRSPGPKIWGKGLGVEVKVLQPKKLDEEFWQFLKAEHAKENFDLFIVIAYGKIIPERIINFPKHGTINLHYSLLPKYRGASPVESAILNGDIETGITIQQMVYKLDAGNILFQEKMEIRGSETTNELREKMNKRALEIFPTFLIDFFSSQRSEATQNEAEATSCGKFSKADLDITKDLENKNLDLIYKKYKAFNKKIFFFFTPNYPLARPGDVRVKITEMKYTGSTGVEITKVLPESKKEISLKDFENSFGKII